MTVFSNPSARSVEQAAAYKQAVLDLVGTRDRLAVLSETPAALDAAVAGLTREQLARPEVPGKWSIAHVVQHLADSEVVWAWRMRLVLAQDRPPITGYDQDLWAERLRYRDADVSEALDQFRVLRRANLRLLAKTSAGDRRRVGLHAERGEESVDDMIGLYAGHDLLHLRQIERIRRSLSEG